MGDVWAFDIKTLPTYLLMQQSPWKANRFSASQGTPRISWNPKVHYHIHKCFLREHVVRRYVFTARSG